jgi:FHA domain/Protein of unknown function (DUF3662)
MILALLTLIVLAAVAVLLLGYVFSWPLVRVLDPIYEPLSHQAPRGLSSQRLQKRVLRAALDRISVGINGGLMVPTAYEVRMAPEDIEVLGGLEDWFANELSGAVADKAQAKGARVGRPPSVMIVADEARPLSRPLVNARFEQPTQMAPSWEAAPPTAVEAATVAQATWLLVPVGEGAPPDGSGAIQLTGTEVVVGRSRAADVTVDDGTVSSRHLRFEALPDGRWGVADLGSTNGTRHNGSALSSPAVLSEGDEIRIGALTWRVERR